MRILSYASVISLFSLISCFAQKDQVAGLSDKQATRETQVLYENLKKLAVKGIMFGHQDDLAYGIGWKEEKGRSDVKGSSSDYPAVFGWDFSHLELGDEYNIDSVKFDDMRNHIIEVHAMGGINTVSWHLDNPLTGGNAWDITSKNVVKSILPGGARHDLYKTWLNRITDFLLTLKDKNGNLIPILFRPFHEHTGSWFWWGKNLCTTEEYVQLYRFTADYLRNVRNVHNLIFAYSPGGNASRSEYLERFPGDDYVDIFGCDIYCGKGDNAVSEYIDAAGKELSLITSLAREKNKLSAFTETGLEQITNDKWWTQVLWNVIKDYQISYVLVWRNAFNRPDHFYAPYPGHASVPDFIEFKNKPETFFLQDVSKEITNYELRITK